MKYEVVEQEGEWTVCSEGQELARHPSQDKALEDVAERLKGADKSQPSSLSVRYAARG